MSGGRSTRRLLPNRHSCFNFVDAAAAAAATSPDASNRVAGREEMTVERVKEMKVAELEKELSLILRL